MAVLHWVWQAHFLTVTQANSRCMLNTRLKKEKKKKKRLENTYSMFSVSALPQPPAWVCCLIYPSWSWALLHGTKSTLARSTCYYLLSGLLVCQKHTKTKSSSGAMTQEGNKGNTLLLLPLTKETSPAPASVLRGVESPTCPSGWRQAARCSQPIWELLSACRDSLVSSQRTGSESAAWICCYLRPWIQESLSGWAEHAPSLPPSHPHSQPLFVSPLLSHHYLDRSPQVNVEASSLLTAMIRRCAKTIQFITVQGVQAKA